MNTTGNHDPLPCFRCGKQSAVLMATVIPKPAEVRYSPWQDPWEIETP